MGMDGSGCGHVSIPYTQLSAGQPFLLWKARGIVMKIQKIATRDTKRSTQDTESGDTKSQWMLVIIVSTYPILHIPQGDLACWIVPTANIYHLIILQNL